MKGVIFRHTFYGYPSLYNLFLLLQLQHEDPHCSKVFDEIYGHTFMH